MRGWSFQQGEILASLPPSLKSYGVSEMRHIDYGLSVFEVHERFYEIGSPIGLSELENFFTDTRGN